MKGEPDLIFPAVEATKEEWSEIPRLVAKYVLTLEMQQSLLGRFCKRKFEEETTAELRAVMMKEIARVDKGTVEF